jgi:hypothetical protein
MKVVLQSSTASASKLFRHFRMLDPPEDTQQLQTTVNDVKIMMRQMA